MTGAQWVIGTFAFAVELALWVAWPVVGWSLGRRVGPALGWAAAIGAGLVIIVFWALWMSPTADHRLPLWPRTATAVGLMLVTGLGLVVSGRPVSGVILGTVGALVMAIGQPALDR